jgi:hypothetical protein
LTSCLTRPKLLDYTVDRAEMLYRAGDIFNWIKEGRLKVPSRPRPAPLPLPLSTGTCVC